MYNVFTAYKDNKGETRFHSIGIAFDSAKGGIDVRLNSLPVPDETGSVRVFVRPKQDDQRAPQQRSPQGGGSGFGEGYPRSQPGTRALQPARSQELLDDEVPF